MLLSIAYEAGGLDRSKMTVKKSMGRISILQKCRFQARGQKQYIEMDSNGKWLLPTTTSNT